jgi:hypothetical protein
MSPVSLSDMYIFAAFRSEDARGKLMGATQSCNFPSASVLWQHNEITVPLYWSGNLKEKRSDLIPGSAPSAITKSAVLHTRWTPGTRALHLRAHG